VSVEATVYVGNLDERVNEAILWELMVQAGPVAHVHIPRDRISQQHQGYGFVELRSEEDADYAAKIMNMIKLYGKPLKIKKATDDKKSADVGANLFIGSLANEVDEKLLSDTFSAFGPVLEAKVARDPDSGLAKGYGFVNFDNFESADAAIEAMNGQFLCNKPITVQYSFKKDGKGERHGTAAERLLAMQAKKAGITVAQAAAASAGQPSPLVPPNPAMMGYGMMPPPGYPPAAHMQYGYPPMMHHAPTSGQPYPPQMYYPPQYYQGYPPGYPPQPPQ
jgi:splicing factor 3B subunit 4